MTDFDDYTSTTTLIDATDAVEPGKGRLLIFFGTVVQKFGSLRSTRVRVTKMAYWGSRYLAPDNITEFNVTMYQNVEDAINHTNGTPMGSFTYDYIAAPSNVPVPAHVFDLIDATGECLEIEWTTQFGTLLSATTFGKILFEGVEVPCIGDPSSGNTDYDEFCDDTDICPTDPTNADADNDGICDLDDLCIGDNSTGDTDGDQICDDQDLCFGDNTTGDADGDQICDDQDLCFGSDAAGDTDGDLICDDSDLCPTDPDNTDVDGDGVCDIDDLCIGDNATGDTDGDQICDNQDLCFGSDAAGDTDGDLICDGQ